MCPDTAEGERLRCFLRGSHPTRFPVLSPRLGSATCHPCSRLHRSDGAYSALREGLPQVLERRYVGNRLAWVVRDCSLNFLRAPSGISLGLGATRDFFKRLSRAL